jgi:hypothetical protein
MTEPQRNFQRPLSAWHEVAVHGRCVQRGYQPAVKWGIESRVDRRNGGVRNSSHPMNAQNISVHRNDRMQRIKLGVKTGGERHIIDAFRCFQANLMATTIAIVTSKDMMRWKVGAWPHCQSLQRSADHPQRILQASVRVFWWVCSDSNENTTITKPLHHSTANSGTDAVHPQSTKLCLSFLYFGSNDNAEWNR